MNTNKPIPDENECLAIMKHYGMFPNIISHSVQVKNVAEVIALNLKDDVKINIPLLLAGALLHDIAKSKSISEHLTRHDLLGADMLNDMGLQEIAFICASHVELKNFAPDGPLEEREIVHYADKRVKHDIVVSLDERIEDLIERYAIDETRRQILRNEHEFVKKLEKKIVSFMKVGLDSALSRL